MTSPISFNSLRCKNAYLGALSFGMSCNSCMEVMCEGRNEVDDRFSLLLLTVCVYFLQVREYERYCVCVSSINTWRSCKYFKSIEWIKSPANSPWQGLQPPHQEALLQIIQGHRMQESTQRIFCKWSHGHVVKLKEKSMHGI